jgi:hypothetical protein
MPSSFTVHCTSAMMPKDYAELLVELPPEVEPEAVLLPPQPSSEGLKAAAPAPAVATTRKRRRDTPVGCAASSFFLSNMNISPDLEIVPAWKKRSFTRPRPPPLFIFLRTEERRRRRNAHPLPSISGMETRSENAAKRQQQPDGSIEPVFPRKNRRFLSMNICGS